MTVTPLADCRLGLLTRLQGEDHFVVLQRQRLREVASRLSATMLPQETAASYIIHLFGNGVVLRGEIWPVRSNFGDMVWLLAMLFGVK
jgi:hypothetical protein